MRLFSRPVLLTILAGSTLAGAIGYTLGQRSAALSESDVINHFAAEYVRTTGGDLTDCLAVPGAHPEIWISVICGTGAGQHRYHVNAKGREVETDPLSPTT